MSAIAQQVVTDMTSQVDGEIQWLEADELELSEALIIKLLAKHKFKNCAAYHAEVLAPLFAFQQEVSADLEPLFNVMYEQLALIAQDNYHRSFFDGMSHSPA